MRDPAVAVVMGVVLPFVRERALVNKFVRSRAGEEAGPKPRELRTCRIPRDVPFCRPGYSSARCPAPCCAVKKWRKRTRNPNVAGAYSVP